MVEQRDQHGGHRMHVVAPLGLDQLQHHARIEDRHHHEGAASGERAQLAAGAASDMEQRHGADPHAAFRKAYPHRAETRGIDDAAVVQAGPLGRAGGARGELDLDHVARRDRWQRHGRIAGGDEGVPVLEAELLAQRRQGAEATAQQLTHVDAAVVATVKNADRAGGGEHMLQLAGPVGRIDRDQHQARHGRAMLQQHPFGAIG